MIVDPSTFTTWAAMRSRVLPHVPECPNFLIDTALKDAAGEFFRDSRVWRSAHGTLLTTVADTVAYAYTPASSEAEVVAVQTAWIDDEELDVIVPGEQEDPWPSETRAFPKVGARPLNTLYLSAKPAAAGAIIKGTLSFKPAAAATGIPTQAWAEWGEEIARGAASKLVTEAGKPWSNPGLFDYLNREFTQAILHAGTSAGPSRRRPMRAKVW